jgi:hypothetical protein
MQRSKSGLNSLRGKVAASRTWNMIVVDDDWFSGFSDKHSGWPTRYADAIVLIDTDATSIPLVCGME